MVRDPANAHYGRDAGGRGPDRAALAASGRTLRELAERLPHLSMLKEKSARPMNPGSAPRGVCARRSRSCGRNGRRAALSQKDEWLHVRASGTEPVVRFIAESPSEARSGR